MNRSHDLVHAVAASRWPAGRGTTGASSSGHTGQLVSAISSFLQSAVERKVQVARREMGIDITWVTDRIGVGGGIWTAENMALIAQQGITHIIDMQIEFDDTPLARAHGIEVCWNPVDDDFEPKPAEVFELGVGFALAALEEKNAKIFVHCAAGVHRAPMMTLAVLCALGYSLDDGMDLIVDRRPVADFAEVYIRSVEDFLQSRV